MIENKLKYSENHFFATNLDYVLNTNSNKILAGKWCSKDFIKEGADKSEYVPHVWENIIERENDYIFIKKIMEKYCEKLSAYLNSYNQVNYPVNFWKILILPWLTYYLPSQLYRWKIIQETINIKKNFSFFLYSESKIKKKVFDTVNYYQLIKDDEEFNYNQFSRIIKY